MDLPSLDPAQSYYFSRRRLPELVLAWCFVSFGVIIATASAPVNVADAFYASTRCNELSISQNCQNYERCKVTHRCPRGDEDYTIRQATHESFTRQFAGGKRSSIPLLNDFEDWKSGTFGWTMQPQPLSFTASSLGWDTFDFTVIGSLELSDGYLVFDTDKAQLWGDVTVQGKLVETQSGGTKVAVFNFMTVYLGRDVKVRFRGSNAVSIMSRSSMIIDTTLEARPGTLGGFPGGGFVGVGVQNNNQNGPGSASVRVYVKTLSTFAAHIPEIQEIETSAASGQKIQGYFVVSYGDDGSQTHTIPYDASAYDVQKHLEMAFPDIGNLLVERDDTKNQVPEISRLWRVTFLTAVGNVPQLRVQSFLTGLDSQVVVRTVREGNELSGSFRLALFGITTSDLPYDISADALRLKLLTSVSSLVDARVVRTDASSQCLQGSTLPDQSATSSIQAAGSDELFQPSQWLLPNQRFVTEARDSVKNYPEKQCAGGRGAAGGFVWKIQLWATRGNRVATSPSSPRVLQSYACEALTIDASSLSGTGASGEVVDSHCFSLSFGGAGGSFASKGGDGYGSRFRTLDDYAAPYLSDSVIDLLGGSGGAGGGEEPIDVFPVVQPTLGGAGGGAIHLRAINDIVIGTNGKITANGGNGAMGYTAGGGGSGGSILLESSATISHHGTIEAVGGHGGPVTALAANIRAMPGGGGSGGRIAVYAESVSTWKAGIVVASGGASQDPSRSGGRGSTRIQVRTSLAYRVDPSVGAAGTSKSLLMSGTEDYASGSDGILGDPNHQHGRNGPTFRLAKPSQPERITFYVMYDGLLDGSSISNRGSLFGIHGVSTASPSPVTTPDNKNEFMIAIAIVDGAFAHEANAFHFPRRVFQRKIQKSRWYKIDVFINWFQRTYSIALNDVLKVPNTSFKGVGVAAISLNNYDSMSTWWDEIYVGDNFLKDFKCPSFRSATPDGNGNGNGFVVVKKRVLRKLWADRERGPATTYHPMVKHENHLSQREVFKHNNGGLIPLDGVPHREYFNDVREVETELPDGSGEDNIGVDEEIVPLAEMLTLHDLAQDSTIVMPLETSVDFDVLPAEDSTGRIQPHGPTMYWYSEVYNVSTGFGAVGTCSTLDFVEWRNEGIMFYFTNVTDPFGDRSASVAPMNLLVDRPKVLFNKKAQQFVMWMHVDNITNTMGLNGVATSAFPNGPFKYKRSFYPDAPLEAPGGMSINETHDQTIAVIEGADPSHDDRAYLIRTFFRTVEYWLPRPVMDPLWQSVQTSNGTTDFGLSYHRAFYHDGYDNPNDIYLQRWRMEDVPWEVTCCEPTNTSKCTSFKQVSSDPAKICPNGLVKTDIVGQSQMEADSHLKSRYKDPLDDANSFFLATSVPSHTTWGFQVYNVKTWRGNYFDALSTNITEFLFHRFAGEGRRLEIAADPRIPFQFPNEEEVMDTIKTSDTEVVDLLLGTLGVPMSVEFSAKYSSYDLAELDLNGDGKITSSEISSLTNSHSAEKLSAQLVTSLTADFDAMKRAQVSRLDANADGEITFSEFQAWIGLDPSLMFDQFDLDKSGYLDENELARLLWYRQLPRLDTAMILLDPAFDGRVYYHRFRDQLLNSPDYMFNAYDVDKSDTLTQSEIDLMVKDLGAFANRDKLEALKDPITQSIQKADYIAWLAATTSLVETARNKLKIDNAVHATRPDSLTGPLHVVERRRAKYVAISQLSSDFLSTKGLLKEVEGDFEGREALINYFAFAEDLFGLRDEDIQVTVPESERPGIQPYRLFLAPSMLGDRASYWNGRHWEGRPSAPSLFTYGKQCQWYAGSDATDGGCPMCLTRATFVTPTYEQYQSIVRSDLHCQSYKELDAYIKEFDQQVAIQLQYQQQSVYGPQGLQSHMSPCFNQTQFFPCDVHKVFDGNIADSLRNVSARSTPWNLAWENHPNNLGSSEKIRANENQRLSRGPSFIERFPNRVREPLNGDDVDVGTTLLPDEFDDILGGGR